MSENETRDAEQASETPSEGTTPDAPANEPAASTEQAAQADATAQANQHPSTSGESADTSAAPDAPGTPPAAEAKPAEAEAAKPAEAEAAKPAEAEAVKPAEAEAAKPTEAEAAKPTEEAKPAEGQPAAEGQAAGGEDKPKKKKRRRRRKKKKGGEAQAGAAGEGGDDKKKEAHLPFVRFFEGEHAIGKRHAFAVGEIIAGRVAQVEGGAILVDLFGKATAVMDVAEPREIPERTPEQAAAEAETSAGSHSAPEAETSSGTPAETGAAPDAETAPGTAVAAPEGAEPAPASASQPAPEGIAPPPAVEPTPATQAEPGAEAPTAAAEATPTEEPKPAEAEAQPTEAQPAEEPKPAEAEAKPAEEAKPEEAAPTTQAGEAAFGDLPTIEQPVQPTDRAAAGAPPVEPTPAVEEPPPPPPEPPNVGEILRGRVGAVCESGHIAIVNRIVDRAAAKARVEAAREDKRRVEGLVFGFNRGGFDVLVEGVRAFCPASGMSLEPIDDPNAYVGKKLEFTVPPKKGGAHGIVVSRKNILEREQRKARKARLKSLEKGQKLKGRVTQVREFGLFVDIGDGLEGLVHQSELSWTRGTRPADVAKPGDEVEVEVLEAIPEGKGKPKDGKGKGKKDKGGRVSLSMRTLQPDPWDAHADVLEPGKPRKAKVVSTTDFGAFLELAPGIEGLLHISELGRSLKHAKEAVNEGDELDVVVERVDKKQRRISLSKLSEAEVKAVEEGTLDLSERPKSLKPGSHVKVLVDKVEHHGIQVQVRGVLGRRGRGYLPNRELGTTTGGKQSLEPGTEIEVKIVGTDRDGGLRVSVKGREIDEERKAVREYRKEAAKQGLGTFGDLLRAKLPDVQGSSEGGS